MITIAGIADTHGAERDVRVPEADILVVAGDFCTFGKAEEIAIFNTWLGTLPHKHKIVVPGNHDLCCEGGYLMAKKMFTNATYLDNEATEIMGLKFWGCPYTPEFGDWAFMYPRDGKKAGWIWAMVPGDTDVLITHGPPSGPLGTIPVGLQVGEDAGCKVLRDKILTLPKLKLAFHGHIHEGAGIEQIGNAKCMNVSVMGKQYDVIRHGIVASI